MIIGHYTEFILFYIIKLSPLILVIFKMLWLKKYNLGIISIYTLINIHKYHCIVIYMQSYVYIANNLGLDILLASLG